MAYRYLSKTSGGTKINRKPGMGGRNLDAKTYAWNYDLPCKNPSCKSYGKSHPNCQCYGGGGYGDRPEANALAEGGVVHFCASDQPHHPSCEYYSGGGEVQKELPHEHHSAVSHGLLGLLTNVGHASMAEPEKHTKLLQEAKSHASRLNDPIEGLEEPKKTLGVKLGANMAQGNHEDSAELMQGHPLVGSVGKSKLTDIMGRLSGPALNMEPNAEAFRGSVDFMHSALKGHELLKKKTGALLGAKDLDPTKPDKDSREALKSHLADLHMNPSKMLDIGGNLGHYMPDQAAGLGALAATSTEYLNSLKPKSPPMSPLDNPPPPDKMQTARYDRQVDIAQQPLLVLQHVKDGTLQPQDVTTLTTLYPQLKASLVKEAGAALINARSEGTEIPYRQKLSMSMLLGQPLDSTMTPFCMQSIMKAQGHQQMQQQGKGPKKASGVELNQINKVNSMAETPLEHRQIDKKE